MTKSAQATIDRLMLDPTTELISWVDGTTPPIVQEVSVGSNKRFSVQTLMGNPNDHYLRRHG
jgi:hypothetical protein